MLPLLPQVGQLSVGLQLSEPQREVSMLEWRRLLSLAVELGSGDAMDTGESNNIMAQLKTIIYVIGSQLLFNHLCKEL